MKEDRSAFVARAQHPGFGEEAVNGRITMDRFRFRFDAEAGGSIEMPLTRLGIERMETGELQFTDPQQGEAAIYCYDPRVLQHPALREQAWTRNQVLELRRDEEMKGRLKLTGYFLAGFAGIAILGWISLVLLARAAVARIPAKVEEDFGAEIMKEVKKEFRLYKDAKLQAKLDIATAPLLSSLPKTALGYQFYFVDEDLPNAFALPGGHVLITRGMMDLVSRPEELAGAIAHEVAHVNEKHIFRKVLSQVGPYVIFQVLAHDDNSVMGMFGAGSELLINQSFSQELELEADAVGWDYLVKARIDPRGMTDLFMKLKEEQDRRPFSTIGIAAFSSHPATEKRIRVLEKKWQKVRDKSRFTPIDKGEYW